MSEPAASDPFIRRLKHAVAIGALALGMLFLVWAVSHLLLMLFAAILGALFLDGMSMPVQRILHLPRLAAIAVAGALLLTLVAGFGVILGPQLTREYSQLSDLLPRSIGQIRAWVDAQPWGHLVLGGKPGDLIRSPMALLGQLTGVFSTTVGFITSVGIVLVMAFYLVIQPSPYVRGLIRLVPPSQRKRAGEVLEAVGHALRWWLVGRSMSMLAVGILTLIGLSIISLPAALALAVVAGLFTFVPFIGAIVSIVPALLISLTSWPWQTLWVLIIYSVVQFLEGNIITPVIQQRAVSIPPVVLLVAQVGMGILFGIAGMVLATPITVVAIVMVQMLYLQDVLHEPVRILGQHDTRG